MAAVVRVKRRIDEDPAEALIISCKRLKQDARLEASNSGEIIRLSYAGTLASKDASVSTHIRDSLRKQTLQAQYKQHSVDVAGSARAKSRAAAKASRYKIVCSKRAVDLDCLDISSGNKPDSQEVLASGSQSEKENVTKTVHPESHSLEEVSGSKDAGVSCVVSDHQSSDAVENLPETAGNRTDEGVFMYDVEEDGQPELTSTNQVATGSSGITCNGVELISRRGNTRAHASRQPFVYDLYFSELEMQDFRSLEEILYIEAMHDDLAMQSDREEVCEEVYDDEDDSNDESNWRNDYPDEDPHFLENDLAYIHNNDMELLEYDSYHYGDEDSLNEWMTSRCAIGEDGISSDDEDALHSTGQRQTSYRQYMRQVHHEMTSNGSDISSSED